MQWQLYIPAFLLGLVSSFHCVGMCGPISLLLPYGKPSGEKPISGILIYNGGRIITYSLLGIITGYAGHRLYIAGMQQYLSITLGTLVMIAGTLLLFHKKIGSFRLSKWLMIRVQKMIERLMQKHGLLPGFFIGMVNGLLPCSMVYFAIAGSTAIGSIAGGGLFMFFFGLGTVPLMFIANYYAGVANIQMRNLARKLIPVSLMVMGSLLIVRGLNLDIPYLSPKIDIHGDVISCH